MGRIEITQNDPAASINQGANKGDWRRMLPGLVISAISLVAVFYFADLEQLVQALWLADYRLIFLAILAMILWLLVRAVFWRTLLREKAGYGDVFWTINEGYLINNLLPFRLGEVARAFLISIKSEVAFWEALSSIIIERVVDLTIAVGLLLVTLPFVVDTSWERSAAVGTAIVILVVFVVLYLLARNHDWALRMFEGVGQRAPFILRLGGNAVPAFFSGLEVLTDGWRFLRAIGWDLLNWGVALMQYYLLLLAFFPNGKLLWSSFALAVTALGISVPSSPGALGVFEAAMVGALGIFGKDPSTALALAITGHLLQYLVTGILGAYGLARDGESLTGLYRRIRRIQPVEDQ